MNCTATWRRRVDIGPPPSSRPGRKDSAPASRRPAREVKVHTTYRAAASGRRFELDFIKEALEASKATGVPVKVICPAKTTRATRNTPACFHGCKQVSTRAATVAWAHRVVAPSIMPGVPEP